jgi:hypothetical protein
MIGTLNPFLGWHAQQYTLLDPITAPPASAQLTAASFSYKFDTSGRNIPKGEHGSTVVSNMTALQGTLLEQAVITLGPCSLRLPHTHVSVSISQAVPLCPREAPLARARVECVICQSISYLVPATNALRKPIETFLFASLSVCHSTCPAAHLSVHSYLSMPVCLLSVTPPAATDRLIGVRNGATRALLQPCGKRRPAQRRRLSDGMR